MLVQVRFVVETKVRIYPGQERFWYYTRKVVARRWRLVVRRLEQGEGLQLVEVVQGEEVQQVNQGRMSALTSQLATLTSSWRGSDSTETELLVSPGDDQDEDSGEEPILSGELRLTSCSAGYLRNTDRKYFSKKRQKYFTAFRQFLYGLKCPDIH